MLAIALCGCFNKKEAKSDYDDVWCDMNNHIQYEMRKTSNGDVMLLKLDENGNTIECEG